MRFLLFIIPILFISIAYGQEYTYTIIYDDQVGDIPKSYENLVHKAFQNWMILNPSLNFKYNIGAVDIIIIYSNDTDQTTPCNHLDCMITVPIHGTDCTGKYVKTSNNQLINLIMHDIGHYLGIPHNSNTTHLMYDIDNIRTVPNKYTIPKQLPNNYYEKQIPIMNDINTLNDKLNSLYQEQLPLYNQQKSILAEYGLTQNDLKDKSIFNFHSSVMIRLSPIQDELNTINTKITNIQNNKDKLIEQANCFFNLRIQDDDIITIPLNSKFRPITYYIGDTDLPNQRELFDIVRVSFQSWQDINPTLTFIEREHANSNILVLWEEIVQAEHIGLADCDYRYDHNCILIISIGDYNCNNRFVQLDPKTIQSTVEHEIGHVLGLGHHKNTEHLMFSQGYPEPEPTFNDLGFNIPEGYGYYYTGQKDILDKMNVIDLELTPIKDKFNILEYDKDELLVQYGLTEIDLEYMGYVIDDDSFRDKYNSIVHEMNYLIDMMRPLFDQHNKLHESWSCFPNVNSH